jgi:glucose/arabinose dehydrogenase
MLDGTIVVRKFLLPATVGAGAIAVGLWLTTSLAQTGQTTAHNGVAAAETCRENDAGITLPPGFCATMFADKLGHPRHMVVASDGVVYVNTWSGRYYQNDTPPPGGLLIALKDSKGDGHADIVQRFGATRAEGIHGGTGIALYKGWLYAEVNDRVIRYTLKPDEIAPTGKPETILSGMPLTGDHPMHPFSIDAAGNMYIDRHGLGDECLPVGEPNSAFGRDSALHRTSDSCRHVAV